MALPEENVLKSYLRDSDFASILNLFGNKAGGNFSLLQRKIADLFVEIIPFGHQPEATFLPLFERLTDKEKVEYVWKDGRNEVVHTFTENYFPKLPVRLKLKILESVYSDDLAGKIWTSTVFTKDGERKKFFALVSEEFTVNLLTHGNVGGAIPSEELLILVAKLKSYETNELKNEVLNFISKEVEKENSLTTLLKLMPFCPRDALTPLAKKIGTLVDKTQDRTFGVVADPNDISFFADGSTPLETRGALVTIPVKNKESQTFSIRIAFNDISNCDVFPLTVVLLRQLNEVGNIFLETTNGKKTNCIGSLTAAKPIFKVPYPLPYLGRYGCFNLIIVLSSAIVPAILENPFETNATVMILNPYHSGQDPNRMQFADIQINNATKISELLQQASTMLNIPLNNSNKFFGDGCNYSFSLACRDGRTCDVDNLVTTYISKNVPPVFMIIKIDRNSSNMVGNKKRAAQIF